jgi:transposase
MERFITMSTKELSRLEVIERLKARSLSQSQAANILGVSIRQVKRLVRSYKAKGAEGLISRKRGAKGNHQLPEEVKEKAVELILRKYSDFGPTLAHEKLVEVEGLRLSVGSVRNLMIRESIWEAKKIKRKRIHQLRQRRPSKGELVQIDGSEHGWFEERGPKCTLLVYIDDATSALMELRFAKSESVFSYFEATRSYIEKHGRPLAFYSDKHAVLRVNRKEALSGTGVTQFGRAVKELDIRLIYANSPQAKGRVERSNRTLQDRLVKELRLRNICTIEEANAFLPTFVEEYNRRFAVKAQNPTNAHRSLLKTQDLDAIFTIKEHRHLSKNLTLQYKNVIYQIITDRQTYALRGVKVSVSQNQEGEVRIFYKNIELDYCIYEKQEKQGEVIEAKRLEGEWERLMEGPKKQKYVPSRNHPWKRSARKPRSLTV